MLRAFLAGRIMRNIWITVSYEGSGYAGFQRQENRMTVQEMLENCLLELTGEKTPSTSSQGRMQGSMLTGRNAPSIRIRRFRATASSMR